MAYSTTDVLTWAAAAQPLALIGERIKQANTGGAVDLDLHKKIYVERTILQWQYDQNPTDTDGILYPQTGYVYSLLFPYLFAAQQATGGSGQIVTPTTFAPPDSIDFIVGSDTFMVAGDVGITIPQFAGYGLIFLRNNVPISPIITELSYFTWDRTTTEFTCSPELSMGEVIDLIPV